MPTSRDTLPITSIHATPARNPQILRFSIEGYDLFRAWRTVLEKRLRSGDLHPSLESHLAKYRKLVPALALILHLADMPGPAGVEASDAMPGPVGVEAVQTAIAWSKYLETHARRAYGCVTAAAADTAKAILDKIRTGALQKEFGSRDVWRPAWAKLTDRETVDAGLQMLVDYDWLDIEKVATGGRPQTVYKLNPKAKL
jgi:putative DNA primase/helicase